MTKNSQDELARAYATLSSLRQNIGQMTFYVVEEKYVREFHTALDKLENIGIDVSEFRIPDSEVRPRTIANMYIGDEKQWSTEVIGVERSFILSKLDAILTYLDNSVSPDKFDKPKPPIGFHPS